MRQIVGLRPVDDIKADELRKWLKDYSIEEAIKKAAT